MQWVEPLESGRFDQSEIREHILRMARFMFSCVGREISRDIKFRSMLFGKEGGPIKLISWPW